MNAMTEEAKRHALEHCEPVILQANCVRIGSHSNSDRHDLYRDKNELEYVKAYDPLSKFRRMLIRYERFTEEELDEIEDRAQAEVKKAHKIAITSKRNNEIYWCTK